MPNLIHESVPTCPEGVDSVPVRSWGVVKAAGDVTASLKGVEYVVVEKPPVGHADMAEVVLKMADTLKAGEVAGAASTTYSTTWCGWTSPWPYTRLTV